MRNRIVLLALTLMPVTMAASCPAKKAPSPDTVVDRHTPDELFKAGRKGEPCWQLVVKHTRTGQLEYSCVTLDVWKAHPVGSDAP